MKRVLVVGEINVDLILQNYHAFPTLGREVLVDDFVMTLGSASALAATGLARLGVDVAFYSRVGRDPWGDFCLARMRAAGVDVEPVVRDAEIKTGVTVSISSPSDRALVTFPGSISAVTPAEVAGIEFESYSHLHLSSYFLQETLRPGVPDLFTRATAAGLTTSLDPGFDPDEQWDLRVEGLLRQVDVFLPNEVELRSLTGCQAVEEGLRRLRNGRTLTVAKLGASGAAALAGDRVCRVAPPAVDALDTTGAGDAFNAGFLRAWLHGAPLVQALQAGSFCGAMSTRGIGGSTTQATGPELDAYMHELGSSDGGAT